MVAVATAVGHRRGPRGLRPGRPRPEPGPSTAPTWSAALDDRSGQAVGRVRRVEATCWWWARSPGSSTTRVAAGLWPPVVVPGGAGAGHGQGPGRRSGGPARWSSPTSSAPPARCSPAGPSRRGAGDPAAAAAAAIAAAAAARCWRTTTGRCWRLLPGRGLPADLARRAAVRSAAGLTGARSVPRSRLPSGRPALGAAGPRTASNLAAMTASSDEIGLVWFRRDLRLDDNPAWAAATSQHAVRRAAVRHRPPPARRGPARSVAASSWPRSQALDYALAERGGRLLVRIGDPVRARPRDRGRARRGRGVLERRRLPVRGRPRRQGRGRRSPCRSTTRGARSCTRPGTVLTAKGTLSRVFTPFYKAWAARAWDPWPEPGDAILFDDPGEPMPDARRPAAAVRGRGARPGTRLEQFLERVDDYDTDRDRPGPRRHLACSRPTCGSARCRPARSSRWSARRRRARRVRAPAGLARLVRPPARTSCPACPSARCGSASTRSRGATTRARSPRGRAGSPAIPIVDAGMRQLARDRAGCTTGCA